MLTRIDFEELVDVIVGGKSFKAHIDVVCKVSPFFTAALTHAWSCKEKATVRFDNDDAEVFSTFLHWAYTGFIVPLQGASLKASLTFLVKLYIFADQIGASRLKNDVMDAIRTLCDENNVLIGFAGTRLAFDNTTPKCKLREHIIAEWLYFADEDDIELHMETYPHSMMQEAFRRLLSMRYNSDFEWGETPTAKLAKCYYHEHDEWAPNCTET